jgi:hypothetical protein
MRHNPAQSCSFRIEGENGTGDGLRREWFDGIVSEMLDPARGLFIGKDGGLSLAPNPHSARDCQCRPSPVLCAAGAD